MNETKVKAIVLGGIDYKEKDKLVTLFTLENGIVPVVFKGVKSSNAKLKSAKEMFSFGDFIYTETKNRVIISAEISQYFYELTKDINKYYAACRILDIIKTVLPQGEPNVGLFIVTLKCLEILAFEDINTMLVVNKFLIFIFESLGYKFTLNACNNCGVKFLNSRFMNIEYGDITCYNCRVGINVELTNSDYSALRILSNCPFEKLLTIKIPEQTLKSVFNVLCLNFKHRFNKNIMDK